MNMVKEQLSIGEKQEAIELYETARSSEDQKVKWYALLSITLASGKRVRVIKPDNCTKFRRPHYRVINL